MPPHTLFIGFGNRGRGDDGVGPAIAEVVASWHLAGVKVLALHQLAPELVEDLKQAQRVLFVDADPRISDAPYTWSVVQPSLSYQSLGHHATPAQLLALTAELHGACPQAWLLAIAVPCTDFGETLSEEAQSNMQAALQATRTWLEQSTAGCASEK